MENTLTPFVDELQQMVELICQAVDPEYVLLFGTLAGGTPHSEMSAYDILVVTDNEPHYQWLDLKHYLKLKMPQKLRKISNLNIYVYSQFFIKNTTSLFFAMARYEGHLLYARNPLLLPKPVIPNYLGAYRSITKSFTMLFDLASMMLEDASRNLSEEKYRLSAFYMSRATELFYKALFVVYHNFETDCEDIIHLHQRLRTIAPELIVLFDSDKNNHGQLLNRLKLYRTKSLYSVDFETNKNDLLQCLSDLYYMREIVEKVCLSRLQLLQKRSNIT